MTLLGTLAELTRQRSDSKLSAGYIIREVCGAAIRIERTTCGLRNSDSPNLGHPNPTRNHNTGCSRYGGPDGARLSCPGSSV